MLIYVKIIKKNVFHRTDRRTDKRSTQNYSSEPHKSIIKKTNKPYIVSHWHATLHT